MNPAQKFVLTTFCKLMVILAGRGMGKGLILAGFMLKCVQYMPGCTGGFVSVSVKRAFTNTLPSITAHWEKWGYHRNQAWVIGRRPPKSLGFAKPMFEMENWENVITWYNGSQIIIISQDREGSSNGLTLDFLAIDEGKTINYKQLKEETFPCNRGNEAQFGMHSCHHAVLVTSDMSTSSKGNWMLNFKEKYDERLIDMIWQCHIKIYEIKKKIALAKANKEVIKDYLMKDLRYYSRSLEVLRANAVLYKEYSSIENIQVLGRGFIERMKRDLPSATFRTCILGIKHSGQSGKGFYSNFTDRHKYHASNLKNLDGPNYDFNALKALGCEADADVNRYKPICIGIDYNGNINCLVGAQPEGRRLNIIKSFYVKYERKLRELVDDFCEYYSFMVNKTVVYYFDNTALGDNAAVNNEDYRYVVSERFQQRGWNVIEVYIGQAMVHGEKHLLINRAFAGQTSLVPMVNEDNNEDLIIALEDAGVYNNKKDKRGEKLDETEDSVPLEQRTDFTDAFDTVVIGCLKFPQENYSFTGESIDTI